MAKSRPTFANFGFTKDIIEGTKTFEFNGQTIEVRQYLMTEEKAALISDVLNNSTSDEGYYNVLKVDMWYAYEVVCYYTNLNFTEKQKENLSKVYDYMIASGFMDELYKNIPEGELAYLRQVLEEMIDNIYEYHNSVMGILDTISRDYSDLDLDASSIQSKLADPDNMKLLKDVINKLG